MYHLINVTLPCYSIMDHYVIGMIFYQSLSILFTFRVQRATLNIPFIDRVVNQNSVLMRIVITAA